jgi:hypothetical protein
MPTAEKGAYYVFEMSVRDRKQPLRQVNKSPLVLEKAKQLARIGAQNGKHDRAVTTSPASRSFRIVAQYAAGTGKDVAIMYRRGTGGGGRRRATAVIANAESAPEVDSASTMFSMNGETE